MLTRSGRLLFKLVLPLLSLLLACGECAGEKPAPSNEREGAGGQLGAGNLAKIVDGATIQQVDRSRSGDRWLEKVSRVGEQFTPELEGEGEHELLAADRPASVLASSGADYDSLLGFEANNEQQAPPDSSSSSLMLADVVFVAGPTTGAPQRSNASSAPKPTPSRSDGAFKPLPGDNGRARRRQQAAGESWRASTERGQFAGELKEGRLEAGGASIEWPRPDQLEPTRPPDGEHQGEQRTASVGKLSKPAPSGAHKAGLQPPPKWSLPARSASPQLPAEREQIKPLGVKGGPPVHYKSAYLAANASARPTSPANSSGTSSGQQAKRAARFVAQSAPMRNKSGGGGGGGGQQQVTATVARGQGGRVQEEAEEFASYDLSADQEAHEYRTNFTAQLSAQLAEVEQRRQQANQTAAVPKQRKKSKGGQQLQSPANILAQKSSLKLIGEPEATSSSNTTTLRPKRQRDVAQPSGQTMSLPSVGNNSIQLPLISWNSLVSARQLQAKSLGAASKPANRSSDSPQEGGGGGGGGGGGELERMGAILRTGFLVPPTTGGGQAQSNLRALVPAAMALLAQAQHSDTLRHSRAIGQLRALLGASQAGATESLAAALASNATNPSPGEPLLAASESTGYNSYLSLQEAAASASALPSPSSVSNPNDQLLLEANQKQQLPAELQSAGASGQPEVGGSQLAGAYNAAPSSSDSF